VRNHVNGLQSGRRLENGCSGPGNGLSGQGPRPAGELEKGTSFRRQARAMKMYVFDASALFAYLQKTAEPPKSTNC
jgi:hypothetical protein